MIRDLLENQRFDLSKLLISEGLNVQKSSLEEKNHFAHQPRYIQSYQTAKPAERSYVEDYDDKSSQKTILPLTNQPKNVEAVNVPATGIDSLAVQLTHSYQDDVPRPAPSVSELGLFADINRPRRVVEASGFQNYGESSRKTAHPSLHQPTNVGGQPIPAPNADSLAVQLTKSFEYDKEAYSPKPGSVSDLGQYVADNQPITGVLNQNYVKSLRKITHPLRDQPKDVREVTIPASNANSFAVQLTTSFKHDERNPTRPGSVSDLGPYVPESPRKPDDEFFLEQAYVLDEDNTNGLFEELSTQFQADSVAGDSLFAQLLDFQKTPVREIIQVAQEPSPTDEDDIIYLKNPNDQDIFVPEVSSIVYEPPTQPTGYNFSQFRLVPNEEDDLDTVHPSRYNLSPSALKNRPPSLEILLKSKEKYKKESPPPTTTATPTTTTTTTTTTTVTTTTTSGGFTSFFNQQELVKSFRDYFTILGDQSEFHYDDGFLINKPKPTASERIDEYPDFPEDIDIDGGLEEKPATEGIVQTIKTH